MTTCIRNIEGTNIITPVGSRGCYGHNRLINDIVKAVLEAHPDFIAQVVDADHLNGRPMLESLSLPINNGATISTTQEVHKLKNKIDYTRKDHVELVTNWIIDNGDTTINFIEGLDENFAHMNGINKQMYVKGLRECVQHDINLFKKTGIDDKEVIIIGDINASLASGTTGLDNLAFKINRDVNSLSPEKVKEHVTTAFKNSNDRSSVPFCGQKLVTKSPERIRLNTTKFRNALQSLYEIVEMLCPAAHKDSDLQDSFQQTQATLKGKNLILDDAEALLRHGPTRARNNKPIVSKNGNVTSDSQLNWHGQNVNNSVPGTSSGNTEFKPPFQPPL